MKDMLAITDENNNENKATLDLLDNEPGYYSQVIRSMLVPGHEAELIYWFRNVGLIPNSQICDNAKLDDCCNKVMEWIPAKNLDYYQWKCKNCKMKKNIRNNSIFQDVRCNFRNFARILLAWCKGYNVELIATTLGIKKFIVRSLYNAVTTIAKKYLKYNHPNRHIGGPGVIVIIDTYPDGCINRTRPRRSNRPILCLAEVKDTPPNYWFEALERYNRNNQEQISDIKNYVLSVIKDLVLPGSILVTRLDSTLCPYSELQILNHLYPTIVTVEGLARHDNDSQKIIDNLEVIWRLGLNICEEAQLFNYEQVSSFLVGQMWLSRFGAEAFQVLVNRLTDMQ